MTTWLEYISHHAGIDVTSADPQAAPDACGLDSLGIVLVVLALEEDGEALPADLVASLRTLEDLRAPVERVLGHGHVVPEDLADLAAELSTFENGHGSEQLDPLGVLEAQGARSALASVLPEHVPMLYALASEPRNQFGWWMRGRSVSFAEFESSLWLDVNLQALVVDRSSETLLGMVRIADYHERQGHAQLMALADRDAESIWFMEGVALLVRRAFDMWPLRKLYVQVPDFNRHLVRDHAGLLIEEGRLVGHEYFGGRLYDLRILALHRDAFERAWARYGRALLR